MLTSAGVSSLSVKEESAVVPRVPVRRSSDDEWDSRRPEFGLGHCLVYYYDTQRRKPENLATAMTRAHQIL